MRRLVLQEKLFTNRIPSQGARSSIPTCSRGLRVFFGEALVIFIECVASMTDLYRCVAKFEINLVL